MLVKYDVKLIKGKNKLFILLNFHHDNQFIEEFIEDFWDVKQCKSIRRPTGVSFYEGLAGQYYVCNSLWGTGPKLTYSKSSMIISGENFNLEFKVENDELHNLSSKDIWIDSRELGFEWVLVFASKDEVSIKNRYMGYITYVEIDRD